MLLSCQNLTKEYPTGTVLGGVSFHLEEREKAAIVGVNGAGKTTLLRILVGELEPDSGEAVFARDRSFGYLAQDGMQDSERSIYDELLSVKQDLVQAEEELRACERGMGEADGTERERMMERYALLTECFERAGGYAYRSELVGVLKGLGFAEEDFPRRISTLSGGQKTRVALGKLLLAKPDLILLDEPTNHLDLRSVQWLETYLKTYPGAVLLVSHDRYFLDRVVTRIIELECGSAAVFSGNYTDYAQKKEQLRAAQRKAYLNQQREIRHQEQVIEKLRSFNREKSIKRAESREKMLEKVEVLEKPQEVNAEMRLALKPRRTSGEDVLKVEGLSKAYGENVLFSDVSFEIRRGEHIAILGDNGTGKTTLLKILNGIEMPDEGDFVTGTHVEIGYYDQEHHVLHPEKTLYDELADDFPALTVTQIRNTLAAFLFTGDDVFKRIGDLSGGERGRVSLAKLMLGDRNFLILDEPTNHLDIQSKEILEDAIRSYEGTVLCVSHDRYFINRTATRILDLTEKHFVNYIGNYDYYLEKHDAVMEADRKARGRGMGDASLGAGVAHGVGTGRDASRGAAGSVGGAASENASAGKQTSSAEDWRAKKEEQARIRKRESELKKCEEEIASLEARLSELGTALADPANASDAETLQELAREHAELDERLFALMERWETLAE